MTFNDSRLPAAFWSKAIPEPMSGCWLWTGALKGNGYGALRRGRHVLHAHRFAFEALRHAVPVGLVLDHRCCTPSCVNPEHLRIVTQRANVLRGDSPTAKNARLTHCRRGHEFTPENTKQRGDRRARMCIACIRLRSLARNREAGAIV